MRKVCTYDTQVYIFGEEAKRSPDKTLSRRNVSAIREIRSREIVQNPERPALSMSKPVAEQKKKVRTPLKRQFYLGVGNNSDLVRRVLSHRSNWVQYSDPKYTFINLRWAQSQRGYKYENCIENKVFKQCLNHFEFHAQLSNKQYLLRNLSEYCQANKRNVFDIVPATFILNMKQSSFQNSLYAFLRFFELNMPTELKAENRKLWVLVKGENSSSSYVPDRRSSFYYCKPILQQVYLSKNSSYLWLLKPTFLNRGRGIHVFSKLQTLEQLISSYSNGRTEPSTKQELNTTKNLSSSMSKAPTIKASSFVVQKYLERPMLINGRKFDIRVWVLISQEAKLYFFREGYLRTSSQSYTTDKDSLENLYIHLTNNAVQKYNKSYSKHEAGNQLSFQHLKNLLIGYGLRYETVIDNMKDIIKLTALSVKKKLNKLDRLYCFEIFGYDFMLDETGKAWLIEVNTNPCIQQSSPLLAQLLPRMLDDAFKLTIDVMYTSSSGHSEKSRYVLPFYQNTENVWEQLLDLRKR